MVWTYFRITGYIGIEDGLGLDTLVIPFNKCKNNICVIVGKNGSGKSTLQSALSPLPDPSTCFTQGKTAEKEGILQLQDGTQYHFLIVSAVDINGNRKQTKAFIQKNGEELNSNGNISSYKEIIDTEFDMDPNFMTLTRLSSDDRGLADKKPAERKKYVSAIVSCLETYNGINKALVKKSSIFRSHINSLSSKISTIGDLDSARMNLQALDGRMVSLQKYMSDTQAEIARCQSKVDIIDKDGKIQDEYTNIANSVDEINKAIENINSSIRYRMEKLKLDKVDSVDAEIESCRQSISMHNADISSLSAKITDIVSSSDDMSRSIRMKQQKVESMKADFDFDNLIERLEEYTAIVDKQESILKSCGLYGADISKEEYLMIFNKMVQYRDIIFYSIYEHKDDYIIAAVQYVRSATIEEDINALTSKMKSLKSSMDESEKERAKYEGMLGSIDVLKKRPDKCKIDSCAFISKALEEVAQDPAGKIAAIDASIKQYSKDISDTEIAITKLAEIKSIHDEIVNISLDAESNKNILSKFKESYIFLDLNEFLERIENHNSFNEILDCDKYVSLADSIDGYNRNKSVLKDLLAQKEIHDSKNSIMEEIIKEIEELQIKLSDSDKKIEEYNRSISFNRGLVKDLESRQTQLEELSIQVHYLEEKKAEKGELKRRFMEIKENISNIKDSVDKLNRLRGDYDKAAMELEPLKDNRDSLAYAINRAEEYNAELQEYQAKFNTVETLKKYSSPTSGIQTLYMSLYMNKTLQLANELLQYLFGGYLELMPYVINGEEFRIPVKHGNGMISDDISSCSTAQICMISMVTTISLSLQSSGIFNIFRFDEIDGGLDTENRMMFFDILKRMCAELGIQQMIAISHAIESNLVGVDIIKLAIPGNAEYDLAGANVIYDYAHNS